MIKHVPMVPSPIALTSGPSAPKRRVGSFLIDAMVVVVVEWKIEGLAYYIA